ncbi:hypothetical protein [Chitinophaga flava]|uniref:Uncharacterized protein n=1 Tax=Chitinophaga flava TaxID=2259036 RepID=A0A365XUB9_9BACT|nr:hypothetical protein [Chitinophaga flava]RBL89294.1 hypothetical protein DF182_22495 [Chitinophaga flava]
MSNTQRLSLDDFKLDVANSDNEIEKLMGMAAAACHKTCNPMPDATYIDFVDYEAEMAQQQQINFNVGVRQVTF